MKLYLIRHGESETNLRGEFTGWAQVNLTERGICEAKALKEYLGKIKFDKIYSSDLVRAKHTAQLAIEGCSPEETPLIREINLGELVGKKISDCAQIFGEEFTKNREQSNYAPYGGENREMLMKRAEEFLDKVSATGDECVAAFSHGGFLKAVLMKVIGAEIGLIKVRCTNCTVAVFQNDGRGWCLDSWMNPDTVFGNNNYEKKTDRNIY